MYERTYHANVLKKEEETKKRPSFSWKKTFIIFGALIFCALIIFLIKVERFQVKSVEVLGTKVADPIDVSQFVMGQLQGDYLWFLPKTSIILVGPKKMADDISEHFPRFKNVSVERSGMSGLSVNIEEYPGVYLWCDEECSFMDETGVVFAEAPYFSGSAYLKIYIGERKDYPFQPITIDQLKKVKIITEKLSTIGIEPTEFHFGPERKLTVIYLNNAKTVEIYFDATSNIEADLETLYTGLQTEPLASMYKTQVLKYLDLRFSNKVVYKFE